MNAITISRVCATYDVTPRMLRHYEKLGLLASTREEGYAYRMYDEAAVCALRRIIVLKKLRIPLRQIDVILRDDDRARFREILREHIAEIDGEAEALSRVRDVLTALARRMDARDGWSLAEDETLAEAAEALCPAKTTIKEEISMAELDKAGEMLNRTFAVRMVMTPPCTVAAMHYMGEDPEKHAGDKMSEFIQQSGLYEKKPDSRMFGFNHPNPTQEHPDYGYEVWVTIPDDMEVPAPLTKKKMESALYAAHTIDYPNFQEWGDLVRWAEKNDRFAPAFSEQGDENMGGCLEEHLNWVYSCHMGFRDKGIDGQIDLMLPVRAR